ncbi:MAG: glycoside hydrolase family 3 C-terminal domain-containing protein [Bacteroidales bacterium]|nr:glycoside hydrolase family 3 C-terminal domain-containing protein [Bacteroidales bacterium]
MKLIKNCIAVLASAAVVACTTTTPSSSGPIYLDNNADIEDRIEDALSRMTLEEKIDMVHAQSKFSSPGVKRLGIPELWTTDGPHGIRTEVFWDEWEQAGWTNDSIVAFPALTCLAATWDRDLSALYGKSIGEEARYREKDVLLGPGVNIYRTPLNGRNFEYMGEDPYLASQMVVPYVQEVQNNGVAVCVKHFALNNEETFRHQTDVDLDDRALYEIYLPAFKAAVQEGGAWSVMAAYNLYRGQYLCSNERLLDDILRGEWGFDGAVISDWGGVHETDATVKYGVDLEFGTWTDGLTMGATNGYDAYHLAAPFREGVKSGKYTMEQLDAKVRRVLRLIFRTAMNPDKPFGNIGSEAHYAAARKIGADGTVLLKNDGNLLPIKSDSKKILVVGENAIKMMTIGGGSSSLKAMHEIFAFDAIKERAAQDNIEVEYERGYVGDITGSYNGVTSPYDLSDPRSAEELIADATAKAKDADYVIFVGGLNKSNNQDCEGTDRRSLSLPYDQDAVIEALVAVNPNVIVALVSGNAVAMPWVDSVPSIVQAWYGGSEAGHSLADVLFGDVNPSGKLPFTFPKQLSDSPAHQDGLRFPVRGKNYYNEGIFVGYRWFENKEIEPLFAFGHGLSYTTFEYGDVKASKTSIGENGSVKLTVPVKNVGSVAGAEVVQLYIRDVESSLPRPVKELKGFEKLYLEPGQSATVEFEISADALKFYDDSIADWKLEKGAFIALIGSASDDIRTSVQFAVK